MVTLNFVLDQLLAEVPGGIGRYSENLAREVIRRAPEGVGVTGLVAKASEDELDMLHAKFPGIEELRPSRMSRKALAKAWSHGMFTGAFGGGLIHSPSLFAPLHAPSSGEVNQTVVTVHDTVPWTHPETLTPNGVRWHKAQLKRAWQFASAVVTPTHAVADQIQQIHNFGDRIRVVPGAASSDVQLPQDEARIAEIVERFALPNQFILAVGTLEPRKGIDRLIQAMADPALQGAMLIHAGPSGWGDVSIESLCASAAVDPRRVRSLGFVSNEELAVLYDRATVFCMPSLDEGFGLPLLEAFDAGTPAVHTTVPALLEVAGDATLAVSLDDPSTFVSRLARALANVLSDAELRDALALAARDRAPLYSWEYSADLVWRIHADL